MAARKVSRQFEELIARRVQADLIAREETLRKALVKLAGTHSGKSAAVVERAVRLAVRKSGLPLQRATVSSIAELIRQGDDAPAKPRRGWF